MNGVLHKEWNGQSVKANIEFASHPVTGTHFEYVWNGSKHQTGRVLRSEKAGEAVIFVVDEGGCYALSYYKDC